jgi:2-methylaconitate cis-trans-isomerase PrpF
VSKPQDYASFTDGRRIEAGAIDFVSRVFYMQEMHKTYSATATVCTGAAALIEGTLVHQVCAPRAFEKKLVRFGHPAGSIPIEVEVERREGEFYLKKAAMGRTSRRIMEGFAYVPESLFGT